jgi:hypothetical protein
MSDSSRARCQENALNGRWNSGKLPAGGGAFWGFVFSEEMSFEMSVFLGESARLSDASNAHDCQCAYCSVSPSLPRTQVAIRSNEGKTARQVISGYHRRGRPHFETEWRTGKLRRISVAVRDTVREVTAEPTFAPRPAAASCLCGGIGRHRVAHHGHDFEATSRRVVEWKTRRMIYIRNPSICIWEVAAHSESAT